MKVALTLKGLTLVCFMWVPDSTILEKRLKSSIKPKGLASKPKCAIATHRTLDSFMDALEDPATKEKPKSKWQGSKRHHSQQDLHLPNAKSLLGKAYRKNQQERVVQKQAERLEELSKKRKKEEKNTGKSTSKSTSQRKRMV